MKMPLASTQKTSQNYITSIQRRTYEPHSTDPSINQKTIIQNASRMLGIDQTPNKGVCGITVSKKKKKKPQGKKVGALFPRTGYTGFQ
jgi:hypothetical protein